MIAGRASTLKSHFDWRQLVSWLKLAFVGLMLGGLAACANNFDANVTRFQSQLPPPGQTFAVVADDPGLQNGIEFGQYARVVAGHLIRLGYVEAPSPATAGMVVSFKYGVDNGHSYTSSAGFYGDPYWGPWRGGGGFYRGRGGFYGGGGLWGFGWNDPWFGGIDSYTVYTSDISLKIDDRETGKRLFEGKAQAASTSNRLPYLVPNLIDAMFTRFPGSSGETMHITVAPEKAAAH